LASFAGSDFRFEFHRFLLFTSEFGMRRQSATLVFQDAMTRRAKAAPALAAALQIVSATLRLRVAVRIEA